MRKTKTGAMSVIVLFLLLAAAACGRQGAENPSADSDDPKTKKIVLPEGFAVEHIYSPSDNGQGSWIAMTFDDKGRMITSDQYGALYRIELPPVGSASAVQPKVERLEIPPSDPADTTSGKVGMGFAHGLLWAYNSLYAVVDNRPSNTFSKGTGLYRLQDTDGDGQLDKITELKPLKGSGEHGPHSIILGPDSMIYLVAGNHTDLPAMDAYRLPPNWQHDNLLPHILDPQGHATDRREPAGWIARTDAEGKHWELVSAGYRNPFDIAFNDEGELFTYDADMEWDFGMPWYRPTRICHVTSGSEFGWRTGNAKWDPTYPDNLPAILDIGQGSPTNFLYASKARFPDRYRHSFLAFDWSFGIIYSIRAQPRGASYSATAEEFVSGSPLPLTDGEIGPDGALYFLTGGRRLESNLYRVYYKDHASIGESKSAGKVSKEIALRREIEQYHRSDAPAETVEKVWQYLGHEDRFIRYAARIAIEHQPVTAWQDRVFAERNVLRLTEAMLALARNGDRSLQSAMFDKLAAIPIDRLPRQMLLNLLRTYEVSIARMGKPTEAQRVLLAKRLGPRYPSNANLVDRELGKILVAIGDERVVPKTVAMLRSAKDDANDHFMSSDNLILRNPQYGLDIADMLANIPPAQQIYLATMLSSATAGWNPDLREEYFKWFYDGFGYKGGNSYIGFINRARKIALENVPADRIAYFSEMSGDSLVNRAGNRLAAKGTAPKGPGRGWSVDAALKHIEENENPRDLKRGGELFLALRCGDCHTMRGEGGSVGPDLTQLGTRFSVRDMLEAIIEPSKVISDQYESKVFHMKDGTKQLGRLMGETGTDYIISQNPYAPQVTKEIPKKQVQDIKASEVSMMPPGSLNPLNPDELCDIIAYLMAGGKS